MTAFFEESLSAVRYAQKLAVASGCSIKAQVSNSGYALPYAAACGGIAANSAVANPSGGAYAAGNSHNTSVSPALNVTFDSLAPLQVPRIRPALPVGLYPHG